MAGNPMGSIDLHQSAGLCAQPEAAQGNPQNLSTTTTTVPCYVYQTLFSPTHTQKKKAVWPCETNVPHCLCRLIACQYELEHWICYIDRLGKFNYGPAHASGIHGLATYLHLSTKMGESYGNLRKFL